MWGCYSKLCLAYSFSSDFVYVFCRCIVFKCSQFPFLLSNMTIFHFSEQELRRPSPDSSSAASLFLSKQSVFNLQTPVGFWRTTWKHMCVPINKQSCCIINYPYGCLHNCTGLLVGANLPPTNPSVPAVSHFVEEFTINYLYMQTDSQHAANAEQLLCPWMQPVCNTSLCSMALNWLHSGYMSEVLAGLFRDSSQTLPCKCQLNLIKLQTDSILL